MTTTATTPASPAPLTPSRRGRLKRRLMAAGLAVVLSAGGSAYWALDRFVIDHVQIADVAAYEAAQSAAVAPASDATSAPAAPAVTTATTYTSSAAKITIKQVVTGSGSSTVTYYVADVQLTDATALRSAFANNEFGTNILQNTRDIADGVGAVFAINGDYYGFRETGILIRNGVVYRDSPAREGLVFYRDGTVEVYDETTTSAQELLAAGAWNTLSFGPAVVVDGQVQTDLADVQIDTNVGNHGSISGDNPRSAVGVVDDNHLVFVAVDGRSPGYSEGVTLTELGEIMKGLGATTAYNLDGGGSTTMVFDGQLVNDPLGKGRERGTSDILYVAG
jgi:exopolysaccharide biosynthesis protein